MTTISDWPNQPSAQVLDLTARLSESENDRELLAEALVDLELAAEDRGWQRLGVELARDFSRRGLQAIATNCRVMAVASPTIKRGLALRCAYVWGQGVTVQARATGDTAGQDVNAVVQAFWDDESNQAAFTGSQAQEEAERVLGTDGNYILALFTHPRTGRVQVRSTPFDEIQDIITNPEDRDDPWFYLREYDTTVVRPFVKASGEQTTRTRTARVKVLHPSINFRPRVRPQSIDGIPVQWDAPILHVKVNALDGWKFGIGDAYAALPWARAYDGFLTDWAKLVKALSRFAWRFSGDKSSRTQRAAAAITGARAVDGRSSEAGATAAYSGTGTLEAIPKTGATIDSGSGRPLAAQAAAALGVPVTMLLADPGVTGARATAETLDTPMILEAGQRQKLWATTIRRVAAYVIDQAVKAPAGPLRGTVLRDEYDREVITLAGDVDRTVEVEFPPLDDLDPKSLIEAIAKADETGVLPPLVKLRLILKALRVKDPDEVVAEVTDEDGNFIDPEASAAAAAVEAHRRGEDPARVL